MDGIPKFGMISSFKSALKKQFSSLSSIGSVFPGLSRNVVEKAPDLVSELSYDSFDFGCGVEYAYGQVVVPAGFSILTTETMGTTPEKSEEVDTGEIVDVPIYPAPEPTKPTETVPDYSLASIKPHRFRLSNRILQKILFATIKSAIKLTTDPATEPVIEPVTEPATQCVEDICYSVPPIVASVENNGFVPLENLCSETVPTEQPIPIVTPLEESAGPNDKSAEAEDKVAPKRVIVNSPSRYRSLFSRKEKISIPADEQMALACHDASSNDCSSAIPDKLLPNDMDKPVKRLFLKKLQSLFASKFFKDADLEDEDDSDACTVATLETQLFTNFLRKRFLFSGLEMEGSFTYRAAGMLTALWPELNNFDVSYLSSPTPAVKIPVNRKVKFSPEPEVRSIPAIDAMSVRKSISDSSIESLGSGKLLKSCLKCSGSDSLVSSNEYPSLSKSGLTLWQITHEFSRLEKVLDKISTQDNDDYRDQVSEAAMLFKNIFEKFCVSLNDPVHDDYLRFLKGFNDVNSRLTTNFHNALARSLKYQLVVEKVVRGEDVDLVSEEIRQQLYDMDSSEADLEDITKCYYELKFLIENGLDSIKDKADRNIFKRNTLVAQYFDFFQYHCRSAYPGETADYIHDHLLYTKYDLSCDHQLRICAGKFEPQMRRCIETMINAKMMLKDFNQQLSLDLISLLAEARRGRFYQKRHEY